MIVRCLLHGLPVRERLEMLTEQVEIVAIGMQRADAQLAALAPVVA